MKFVVSKIRENIVNLSRALGYRPMLRSRGEFNCVRLLMGAKYPRFHLFIKEEKDKLIFNLHLDQKRPSYSGSPAHSGEYEGELVEREAERIKKIIKELE